MAFTYEAAADYMKVSGCQAEASLCEASLSEASLFAASQSVCTCKQYALTAHGLAQDAVSSCYGLYCRARLTVTLVQQHTMLLTEPSQAL